MVYLVRNRAIKGLHQKLEGESRIRKVPGTPDHAMKRQNSQGLANDAQVFEAGFTSRVARKGSRDEGPERKGRGSHSID